MLKNVQSTPFAKLKMILQKLDNFHELFNQNKSGGCWLSGTVRLFMYDPVNTIHEIFDLAKTWRGSYEISNVTGFNLGY